MTSVSVTIQHIFTSPQHNYFTREKFNVGDAPTTEHSAIMLEAGKGLKGDRFEFSKYPVTFFSLEVAQEVCNTLEIDLHVNLFRRNVITSGTLMQGEAMLEATCKLKMNPLEPISRPQIP